VTMNDFQKSFVADASAEAAFKSIRSVKDWWTDHLEGESSDLGDEFSVRFSNVHYSKHKLIEVVPNKKIVWLTTEGELNFVKDRTEWVGTKVVFEISPQKSGVKVDFIHLGLNPEIECYEACSNAWPEYVERLRELIESK